MPLNLVLYPKPLYLQLKILGNIHVRIDHVGKDLDSAMKVTAEDIQDNEFAEIVMQISQKSLTKISYNLSSRKRLISILSN